MTPALTAAEIAGRLKAAARAEGFDPVGLTDASPPGGIAAYRSWIAAGHHATMTWLADQADARARLDHLLPGVASVLCLGFGYWPHPDPPAVARQASFPDQPNLPKSATGAVAAFARGRDYHRRLKRKMIRLCRLLETWVGRPVATRCCVDILPILERDLAQRAGLGWIAKNAMLINPRRGSYLYLAEILMALELPGDQPDTDHCGSCRACLDACPTGALVAAGQLDARRCIAYLTIEHRGDLDDQQRQWLGPHIYGCDICQDVCPYNRRIGPTAEADFANPVAEVRQVAGLCALLDLDEAAFAARYAGSAIMRAKRQGLRRNTAIALGHLGDPRAVPSLTRAAAEGDSVVAGAARWALARLVPHK